MWFDLFIMAATLVVGNILFGHFNTLFPTWRRLRKIAVLFVLMAALSYFIGHWSLLFVLAALGGGGVYHWWWCKKYGIDPITAEPREKFESLVREQWNLA